MQDIRHWEVVDIVKDNGSRAKNARNIPLQRIVGFLCKSLDRRRHLFDRVQSVAVEQQPAGRGPVSNIKCKVLSHAIQMWALRSGMEDVQFINPKKKTPGIRTYADRKQAAIDKVEEMLSAERFAPWKSWFDALPKKDDAADCLLQLTAWEMPSGPCAEPVPKRRRRSC